MNTIDRQIDFKPTKIDYNKPYEEQPECKRHVIGAYSNLARHNMMVTINVIRQAIGLPIITKERELKEAFNIEKVEDNISKVLLQKRLYRHFTFLKRLKLEDEKKKSVQLDKLIEQMSKFSHCMSILRNFYTHYLPYNSQKDVNKQNDLKKEIGKRLQELYENSSKVFKSNEKLEHDANEVLAALRKEEKEKIKPGDAEYDKLKKLLDPKTPNYKKKGLKLDKDNKTILRTRYITNPDYPAYMMDAKNGMSDVGIIFFLCLFLDKKDAFRLMDESGFTAYAKGKFTKGTDAEKEKQLLYIKEIMCMNRIRMIRTKLDSGMTDIALALDIISELRKCPKALYEVLPKEGRDEFKDEATLSWENANGKESATSEETNTEEDIDNTTTKNTPRSTLVRWKDRFPQMALSYIDLKALFTDIRFQLNLGKYRYKFYPHDRLYNIDNYKERLRILQKELHGFGRIQEVEEKRKEIWNNLFEVKTIKDGLAQKEHDNAQTKPYVTDQYAQYAIDEKSHSIGLRWEGWNVGNDKMFIPDLPDSKAPALLPPQAMLNLYELPALLFYHYLRKKYRSQQDDTETIIKNSYKNLRRLFKDITDGNLTPIEGQNEDDRKNNLEKILIEQYKLTLSDIPKKISNYLYRKDIYQSEEYCNKLWHSAMHRLEDKQNIVFKTLKRYQEKKKIIGTKENKIGKGYATINTGKLASEIIRDIMDWLPNKSDDSENTARKKLTGQNYQALQAKFALWGQSEGNNKLNDLKCALRKAYLIPDEREKIDENRHHPFLLNVINGVQEETLESFYEKYLECELEHIKWLINYLKSKVEYKFEKIPFLYPSRDRWYMDDQNEKEMAGKYLKMPIQLPNGIFTKPIFQMLQSIAKDNLKSELNEIKDKPLANNVAYLMRLYFERVENDSPQPFYNTKDKTYSHTYRIFKKLYGEPILEERFGKLVKTNRTTTPIYTIEELKYLHKKALVDIKNYAKKDKKQRQDEIEAEREIMKKQLERVYENERVIRRHRTQDMMLFVMAREILKTQIKLKDNKLKGNNETLYMGHLKLKDVMNDSFLEQTVDFKYTIKLGKGKDAYITQDNMKIKEYGKFYSFASNYERLSSLLKQLKDNTFERAEIENEFDYYDKNRSEVFRQVYLIEDKAYQLKPEFKNDENADKNWFYCHNNKSEMPKRNNFRELLGILASGNNGVLSDEEKSLMQTTRNAFGHSTYPVDLDQVFKGKEAKKKIPEISNGITDRIVEATKDLKKSLEESK